MVGSEKVDMPGGSQEQPILVFEDHDVPQSGIGFEVEKLVRQVQKGDARFNPIDLDGEDENLSEDPWRADEDSYDNENAKIEHEELANETDNTQDGPCVHWKKGIRNPCPCGTHQKMPKVTVGSVEICESQVVELNESIRVGRYEAEFVEIHEIWVPSKGDQSFIRGRSYARTRNLEGRIEPRQNEVCEIYELDENDHRATNSVTYLEQALVEVPIVNIKTIRTLHKTNKPFPECRFDRARYRSKEERDDEAPLTCRWQMVLSYPDPRYRRQQRPIAGEVIRHYGQSDVPKDRHRVPDSERRKAHEKIRGGSFVPNGAPEADPETSPIQLAPGQKYTVVDIFSGAGGYSKGAEMAGLKVLAACDHWPRCCETYRQNFPGAELHQEDVYEFIEDLSTDLTREHFDVDILHFSPPCQTWSPAHTCEGKKDEENRATLFACEKIITIFHPRIFTVEQTFGLAQDRWIPNFNALLQGFTRHGYSVKWKVLHLVEYGLPQTRKRLVMMGAAPGEQLPAWPRPTHSKDPKDGQKPLVSAFEVCSVLVEGENLHDVDGARPADKIPWDSSKPLRWTITTSAGQCHHWSGLRGFTLAELAALQGFPVSFRFVGKCVKKQIGNAFPPVVVKTLLKSIRVHLEVFDGVTRLPAPGQIIIVSDGDDENQDNSGPLMMQRKDNRQSRPESKLVVEDLLGFRRKPSNLSRDLLQGMVEEIRETPVQCFLAKASRKCSKDDSSSQPSPHRCSQGRTTQPRPAQRNTLNSYSYFFPADNRDSSTAANTRVGGESSATPQITADSALVATEDDNSAIKGVTAATSTTPFQHPSTSDEETAAQIGSGRQTAVAGPTINAGIISVPRWTSPDSDEPRARRSAQTVVTIAEFGSPLHKTRSSTAGRNNGQTFVGGVLSAAHQDSSDSETDRTMARRSARKARTIADLNNSRRQTRSASPRSTGHRSAQNAQTLADLDEPSSQGRSSSSDAAAPQPARTGRIVAGVLIAPGRQSPPGFNDMAPLYLTQRTTQSVPDISAATQNPAPCAPESSRPVMNAASSGLVTFAQTVSGVIEAARHSTTFPGLGEELQHVQVSEEAAVASSSGLQSPTGVGVATPEQSPGTVQSIDSVVAAPAPPRDQSRPGTGDATTRHSTPTPQNSLFQGAVSSSARQTGIRTALANASQASQAGEGAAGPSRRRSSGDSVAYMGESSRAGARLSLPIVVADDEEEVDEEEDEGWQLQRATKMSMEGAPHAKGTRGQIDRQGFDVDETALACQRSVLETRRSVQSPETDDDHGAPRPTHARESARDMYGPGDSKGKGKEVAPRSFDEYAEDEETQRERGPNKRPRGGK